MRNLARALLLTLYLVGHYSLWARLGYPHHLYFYLCDAIGVSYGVLILIKIRCIV